MVGRGPFIDGDARAKVLQQAGYTVESSLSFTTAIDKFLGAGDFDLVLLCHSIPV